jgi:chitodextrinase
MFVRIYNKLITALSAAILVTMPLLATPIARAANVTVNVNGNQQFQTMDGMGVNINAHSWDNGNVKPALDMLIDQNGSRIFRVVQEMQDWETTNDNSDPNTYNWTYYDPIYSGAVTYDTAQAGANFADLWNTIDYLHQKGIPDSQIILSNMGAGPSWNGGNTVSNQTQLNEWVEMVTSEAYWGYSHGHTFGQFSPDNEMDISSNEGVTMNTTLYANGLNQIASRFDSLGVSGIHLIGPDTTNPDSTFSNYASAMKTYPAVMSKLDHFAAHSYFGTTGSMDSIASNAGKDFWMTEFTDFDDSFSLLNQNAAAILVWEGFDSVYNHAIVNGRGSQPGNDDEFGTAPIAYNASTKTYTPRLQFYQFGQLFKYVPVGAVRVSASSSDSTLQTVAFTDASSGRFTLVGNNTSSNSHNVTISLSNIPNLPASLQYYFTNSSNNMTQGSDVNASGGSITLTVPANTTFTLTGTGTPDTAAPTAPTNLAASGAISSASLSWTASTDNVGVSQYNVYRSASAGFTPSATNKIGQTAATTYSDNGLAAGTYYYQVIAQDAAGNVSPASNEASAAVTSDTTAPTVSITSPTNGSTVSGTTTISTNASDNVGVAGVQFKLDGVNVGAEDTTSPYSLNWDTTQTTDGAHSLTATARDASGNTTTSATVSVTVHNTASTGSLLLGNQTIQGSADNNPAGSPEGFRYTAVASGPAASISFYVDSGSSATSLNLGIYTDNAGHPGTLLANGTVTAPKSASWNTATLLTNVTLTSGTTYWIGFVGTGGQLNYRDQGSGSCSESSSAGGLSALPTTWTSGQSWPSCTLSAYVTSGGNPDTTAPTTSLTAPVDQASVSGTITVTASASDNVGVAGVQFQLDGANLGSEDTTSPYSVNWNTTTVSDGTHVLTAVARDTSGNTTTSSSVTVTVANADTTAPTTSITSPADNATISGTTTAVTASASDNLSVTKVELYVDGSLAGTDTSSPYSFSLDTTALANGSHALATKAYDAANNIGTSASVNVTVFNDTTAPTIPAGLTATSTGMTTASLNWTAATDNVGVTGYQVFRNGTQIATTASSNYNDSGLTSGATYSYTVSAYDAAGNVSAQSSPSSVTTDTDTTAPSVPSNASQSGVTSTTATMSWTASTDNVGVTGYTYYLNGVSQGTTNGTSVTFTGLTCGTSYQAGVDAYDAAGNHSAQATTTLTTTACDTTAPSVTLTAPSNGATVSGNVTVSATATDNVGVSGVQFKLDGVNLGNEDTSSPYSLSWNTTSVANGSHTLTAIARDAAGNTTTATSVTVTVSNTAAPITLDKQVTTHGNKSSSITSPSLTTAQTNELLVALISSDGPTNSGGQSISSVTGGGLTWTLRKRVNTSYGTSEIWTAPAVNIVSNITVKATRSSGSFYGLITVAAFQNANLTNIGAVGGAAASSGAPSASLTATQDGSVVWGVGNDWDGATSRTVGSGQTLVDQYVASNIGDTFWVQKVNATSTTGQVVTVSDTAPTNHQWNLAIVEILPAE